MIYMTDLKQAAMLIFRQIQLQIKLLVGNDDVDNLVEEMSEYQDLSTRRETAELRTMYKKLKLL